jgi:hypothetical protein
MVDEARQTLQDAGTFIAAAWDRRRRGQREEAA